MKISDPVTVRFLVCGDLHWRGTTPRARLDDFTATQTSKLRHALQYTEQYNIGGIIIAGDLFDSPGTGLARFIDLIRLLRDLEFCSQDCSFQAPILTIAGNHDIWGGNSATLSRTPYGVLDALEYIYALDGRHFQLAVPGATNIRITGCNFSPQTDIDNHDYLLPEREPNTLHIHVAHGMLTERILPYGVRHTLISDVLDAGELCPDILIVGHEHIGLPGGFCAYPYPDPTGRTLDRLYVINPGALVRLSAEMAEIGRMPGVALLAITFDRRAQEMPQIDIQMLDVGTAPGTEVLSREHIETRQQQDERLDQFLQLLAAEGEQKFLEVRDIIDSIARAESIPTTVVDEALRRLGIVREEQVGGG